MNDTTTKPNLVNYYYMNPSSPLDSIYYIKVPKDFRLSRDAMKIDANIPLPVQKKERDAPNNFNPTELTQEQILAGILTVLAYDRHNEHLDYYRAILTKARPDIKKELSEAAILKAKNEDWDLAEEIFSALRGLEPDDMTTVLNTALFFDERANSYRRLGLNEDADAYDEDALNYYKTAMDAEPALPDAFFNAGFFYLKKHDYREAKNCFETYIALTCDMNDEELGEAGVYKRDRAQELINNINSQNMDDARFKAAYELISTGQEEKGIQEIRKFLEANQKVWNAWFMLGWGLRRLGRYADAEQAFLEALRCHGGDVSGDTWNELAICSMEQKKFSEAERALKKALALEPESTKIMSNLGFLFLKEGKRSEAKKYFETALALEPDDKIAAEGLRQVEVED